MREKKPRKRKDDAVPVFLNIPYDAAFESKFLAYIAALTALGFKPRATLEIPTSQRRLDRILRLIRSCRYSVHDLSRVQLDRSRPRTPRFNMAFELGLTIGTYLNGPGHGWYVCEAQTHRLTKSLSDLNGTDPHIHGDRVRGVCAVMGTIFRRPRNAPTVQEMYRVYLALRRALPTILHRAGTRDPFNARVFAELVYVARATRVNAIGRPSTAARPA